MASSDPDARIGSVLDGRYRILDRIAQGGMGVVYRAERVPVGRPVAVKFLHAVMAEDPESRSRFERETRALSKLAHPHCVSIIDFGVDGSPYLVMDHVPGVTLRDLLDDGPLPVDEALTVARQLLAGLAHAHAQRIVHRDVKPANIMVSDEIGTGRHVRILDFGLARLRDPGSTLVTQSSIAIGTPSYMAPEQTVGGEVDARTDVYAVGVVLFEMLTGRRPFVADEQAELLEAHRTAPIPRLADVSPGLKLPRDLDTVVRRALAKTPEDRWPSAVEFAAALDAIARGETVTLPAPPPRSGRSLMGAVLLLLVGGGVAVAAIELRGRASTTPVADAGTPAEPVPVAVPMADAATDAVIDAGADAVVDAGADADAEAEADAASLDDASAGDAGADSGSAADDDAGAPLLDDIELEPTPTVPADPDTVPTQADGDGPAPAAVAKPAVAPARTLKEALAQVKQGHRDEAIDGLRALWRKQPKNAQYPYVLGNLYHDKRWWTDAIEHYQAAIARNRAYRSNATIIRNVIDALGNSKTRTKATWFLRNVVGAPAKRYLQAAAKRDASAEVRKRAAALAKRL